MVTLACDFPWTLFYERTWRDSRCASNLSHSKTDGGGIPVDIPNLIRPADRYWAEIPDNDLDRRNVLGLGRDRPNSKLHVFPTHKHIIVPQHLNRPESPIVSLCDPRLINQTIR
jgi:hypothetical protein